MNNDTTIIVTVLVIRPAADGADGADGVLRCVMICT